MKTAFQGICEIIVHAAPGQVWAILEDSTQLPHWAPMVKSTTGRKEHVGATRMCQVEWQGRHDQVVERCVEAIPNKRIAWVMEQGMMIKMFSQIRFWFVLEPHAKDQTLLQLGFLYEPRNLMARMMYRLIMAQKLNKLRQELLENIKRPAEGSAMTTGRAGATVM